ncbi:outer membrane protein assembly factor BamB family protein [Streptomyces adelaidensis]|uniref:outer membrane protein assembly factor BamB family protein n=1 Tax=Streptomyces adelaidensis TaxID=2796465 RepID=UPI0019036571|nr:PQQ-binding-like beta-propeller repeat protein [Streptomyces adelaidensis]
MTQPPDQPPHGGYGTPQNPPPPAQPQPPQQPYGYPQTPPPQGPPIPAPGYGYPQQPPAQQGPYAQPGPYTQPPQQPGPYAQPGPYNPASQAGYGYPQSQYPGAPTPPPGGGNGGVGGGAGGGSKSPFKGRPAMIIGAAVAALLVIGGAVFAVTSLGDDGEKKPTAKESASPTGDDKPSPSPTQPVNQGDGSGDGGDDIDVSDFNADRKAGEAKVLWYKSAPDAPGSGASALGLWVTDKVAVKAAYKQLFAFNVGDGDPAWDAIEFGNKICALTGEATDDDKIVVAYQDGTSDNSTRCNQLQQIDLNTGEKGWSTELEEGALFDGTYGLALAISGDTLYAGRSQSGVALDVRTGKKLWEKKEYGQSCYPAGVAGGTRLIVVSSCAVTTDNQHDEVQQLDVKTGKATWTRKIPKGWKVERAYSVDPVVLYLTNEDENTWNISTLGGDGKTRSQLEADDTFAPECSYMLENNLDACEGVTVAADTLYLPTEEKDGTNEIVALNLATGKEKWRVKAPADVTMEPIKVEGSKLVAYVSPSSDGPGRVVSVPTTGNGHKATTLLQMPASAAKIEGGFYSKAIDYVDGRFYLSTSLLSGNDESKEKLMLAYGK